MKTKLAALAIFNLFMLGAQPASANDNRFPYCVSDHSDSDGDGYGWENNATCLVKTSAGYTVSVRNLTYKQVLGPILAATHSTEAAILAAGHPASDGLAAIAEGGNPAMLQQELEQVSAVSGLTTTGPTPPAMETTFMIEGSAERISLVSMLVNTNDAIMVINSAQLPMRSGEYTTLYAKTWDAGTETNDESCAHIPGPACSGAGDSPDDHGEGFVHIHRGLHGNGELDAASYSWTDPVAVIKITRN